MAYNESVQEGGNDVTVSLKLGGQLFNFANPPAISNTNLGPNAFFSWGRSPSSSGFPSGTLVDEIAIGGSTSSVGPYAGITLTSYGPAMVDQSNLRDLSFPLGRESAYVTDTSGGSAYVGYGTIDSVELVTTPEPSTLAVFAVLGAAAIARRRRTRA